MGNTHIKIRVKFNVKLTFVFIFSTNFYSKMCDFTLIIPLNYNYNVIQFNRTHLSKIFVK